MLAGGSQGGGVSTLLSGVKHSPDGGYTFGGGSGYGGSN